MIDALLAIGALVAVWAFFVWMGEKLKSGAGSRDRTDDN